MKISEFIKQFNELDTVLDIHAAKENAMSHVVEINEFESTAYKTVARLPEDSKDWTFFGCFNFSPEMLELMAELAKTPPEEREDVDAAKRIISAGTTIYTSDGDWISTPTPYEKVRSWLLDNQRPYLEVVGYQGNSYLIKTDNITCIEEKLPGNEEEKK